MLESNFNKVAKKKRLEHRCFPVKFEKSLRAPIFKNICKRLLLSILEKFNPNLTNTDSIQQCEICLKLTMKTPERRQWSCSGNFFGPFLCSFLVFLLSTSNRKMFHSCGLLHLHIVGHITHYYSWKEITVKNQLCCGAPAKTCFWLSEDHKMLV